MSQYRNNNQGRPSGAGYGMGTRTSVPPRTSVPTSRTGTPGSTPASTGSRSAAAPSTRSSQPAHSYGGSRTYAGRPTPSGSRRPSGGKAKWIVLVAVLLLAAGMIAGIVLAGKNQPEAPEPPLQPTAEQHTAPATQTPVPKPAAATTETATQTPSPSPTEQPTAEPVVRPSAVQPQADVYYLYDPSLRWYVQQLTAEEKELFAVLYDGIAAAEETISIPPIKYTKEQFSRVITALQKDCPELVHFNHEALIPYTTQAGFLSSVTFTYLYPEPAEGLAVVQRVLDEVKKLIEPSDRPNSYVELEHRLYRQIVERAVYDKEFEYCANADAVFLHGKAKCSGYAAALNLACRVYGIPCIYVTGEATNDEGTAGHAWNYVQIDGDWYVCDPTWDRTAVENNRQYPEPMKSFLNYFNVTEAQISDTHVLGAENKLEGWILPECMAVKASYWNVFGGSTAVTDKDWQTVLVRQLNEALRGQRQEIVLRVEDQKQYDKIAPGFADRVDEWIEATDNWCQYRYVLSDSSKLLMLYNFAWTEDNPYHETKLQVRFLDVGDADAAIVTCEGHVMIIDGGTEKSGSSQLYSFLENNGITYVDAIVVSHPHSDHAGGLCGALAYEDCSFGTLYTPARSSDNKSFQTLLEMAAQRNLEPVVPDVGMQFRLGGAVVTFVSPEANKSYEDVNNKSLVVRIDYGETSFLFTGDAMENAEEDMLRSGQDLDVDVLKVAHHGADNASGQAFLNAVLPDVAVISCSANNQEHPGAETLARLQQMGTLVLRTDQKGQIVLFSDGQHLTYATEK